MSDVMRRKFVGFLGASVALAACASPERKQTKALAAASSYDPPLHPNETQELRDLINKWSDHYEVPRTLVHRVVIRESTHRPWAINRPYYGLMQILPATARSMGYTGTAEGLLDADTNLEFAVKYLRGAWLVSGGDEADAVMWYARGYYFEAKRLGMLDETGLR